MARILRLGLWLALLCGALASAPAHAEIQGRIVWQQLESDQGCTVLHVWGSHHEMGFAHGYLLGEHIELAFQQYLAAFGYAWPTARARCAQWTFLPVACEEEFQGVVDGVHARCPGSVMDVLDLKAACTFGDWAYSYACRSTCCWDDLVEEPYATLAARKLQFMVLPPQVTQQWHHVICAWEPDDGSPCWINCGFPGYVSAVTAVNEFGTLASLHDWNSATGPNQPQALPRTMACRYVLTTDLGPEPATHLSQVFAELGGHAAATGGFLNYYVPQGGAGVIKSSKSAGFYAVRLPQPEWMDGHVISTNNSDIDGRSGISPWAPYYLGLDPLAGPRATMEGLWDTAWQADDLHILVLGFRERRDMTLWFTGRLQTGNLARLELEWDELFPEAAACESFVPAAALHRTTAQPNPAAHRVTLACDLARDPGRVLLAVHDPAGRCIRRLAPLGRRDEAGGIRLTFDWDGCDQSGRRLPAGVYHYRLATANDAASSGRSWVEEGRVVWLGR